MSEDQMEYRVRKIEDAVDSIKDSMKALVRLEERHAETREALTRAFTYQEKLEERIENIEKQMPGLVEMRGWVVKAMIGTLGLVGVAMIALVINTKADHDAHYALPPSSVDTRRTP